MVNTNTLLQLTGCDAIQPNPAIVLVERVITANEWKGRSGLVSEDGAEREASEDSILEAAFVQVGLSCSEWKIVRPEDVEHIAQVERLRHIRQVRISKRVEIIKCGEIVVIV